MFTAAAVPASARRDGASSLAERLYLDNRQRLLTIARGNCASAEDAEEALHDAVVLFIERFDPSCGSPPLPWLMLTLKRRCWAIYGRRRGLAEVLARAGADGAALSEARTVEELAEIDEKASSLGREVQALRPEERRALALLVSGYSYRDIAARLGCTTKQVDRLLQRVRAKLREVDE
ncbi:MAG TPA: sigma-70 family RNA polymerase sigma factor [Solirubrobacterales bacterium]|nr:sigma-70 family RNA polymerase sigma factor [Solirubrobacterales bacterium]